MLCSLPTTIIVFNYNCSHTNLDSHTQRHLHTFISTHNDTFTQTPSLTHTTHKDTHTQTHSLRQLNSHRHTYTNTRTGIIDTLTTPPKHTHVLKTHAYTWILQICTLTHMQIYKHTPTHTFAHVHTPTKTYLHLCTNTPTHFLTHTPVNWTFIHHLHWDLPWGEGLSPVWFLWRKTVFVPRSVSHQASSEVY